MTETVTFAKNNYLPEFLIGRKCSELSKLQCPSFTLSPTGSPHILTFEDKKLIIVYLKSEKKVEKEFNHSIEAVFWPIYEHVFLLTRNHEGERQVELCTCDDSDASFNFSNYQTVISNCSQLIACGMNGNLVVSLNAETWQGYCVDKQLEFDYHGKQHITQTMEHIKGFNMCNIAVHPTEDHLAIANERGEILLWWHVLQYCTTTKDTKKDQLPLITCLHWHQRAPQALLFNHGGTALFSGGVECTLVKWDLSSTMGQSATAGRTSNNVTALRSANTVIPKKFCSQLPAPIDRLQWITVERLVKTDDQVTYRPIKKAKQQKLCLRLEDNSTILVDSDMNRAQPEYRWLRPPSSTGYVAPLQRIDSDILITNGRTGTLQLFNWRTQSVQDEICCRPGQRYIPSRRDYDYCAVEAYRTAVNSNGQFIASVEKLFNFRKTIVKSSAGEEQEKTSLSHSLCSKFKMQKLRFFQRDEEKKIFYNLDSYVLDCEVLDMKFRSQPEQCFLFTEKCELLIYEQFYEKGSRCRWLSVSTCTLSELGIDLLLPPIIDAYFQQQIQIQYAVMDFSISKHSRAGSLLAVACQNSVHCLSVRSNINTDVSFNASWYGGGGSVNNPSEEKDYVKQIVWHPSSMHLMCLTQNGQWMVLEWRPASGVNDISNTLVSTDGLDHGQLQLLYHIVPPLSSTKTPSPDPLHFMALHPTSLLVATVSRAGKVQLSHWQSPGKLVPLIHEKTTVNCQKLGEIRSLVFVNDSRVLDGADIVTRPSKGHRTVRWTVALSFQRAFCVVSSLTCERVPTISTIPVIQTQPLSRGTKRLHALLASLDENEDEATDKRRKEDPTALIGYWSLARRDWQEFSMATPKDIVKTHPSTWLQRLLKAELENYFQARIGKV